MAEYWDVYDENRLPTGRKTVCLLAGCISGAFPLLQGIITWW